MRNATRIRKIPLYPIIFRIEFGTGCGKTPDCRVIEITADRNPKSMT